MAWPYRTDSRLSLQLALRILVGDARRNAHPTAAGTLGPVSDLDWALLLLQMVPHRQVLVAMFTLPAAGLHICELIDQLIVRLVRIRLVRSRMVLASGQLLLWWKHLMLRWELPGALMAVHAEAALPGYPDQLWVWAGWRGRWQLVGTERSAANSPVDAGTLVFTAGTEALTILIDPAIVLACASL